MSAAFSWSFQGISPKEMAYGVVQGENGFVYYGTNDLVRYDGERFDTFTIPHSNSILSLDIDAGGRLWAGGESAIKLVYTEEDHRIEDAPLPDNFPTGLCWGLNCASWGEVILLQNSLFIRQGEKWTEHPITPKQRPVFFNLANRLYVDDGNHGVFSINPNGLELTWNREALHSQFVAWADKAEDKDFLGTTGSVLTIDSGKPTPVFKKDLSEQLGKYGITDGVVSNGRFLISTYYNGIAEISENGSILSWIDTEDGLPSQNVNVLEHIGPDRIWASTSRGPALIEPSSTYLPDSTNLKSRINGFVYHNGDLLVATMGGLYHVANGDPPALERLAVPDVVNDLVAVGDTIYLATRRGLLEASSLESEASLLVEGDFYQLATNAEKTQLIAIAYGSAQLFEIDKEGLTPIRSWKNLDVGATSSLLEQNTLQAGTYDEGFVSFSLEVKTEPNVSRPTWLSAQDEDSFVVSIEGTSLGAMGEDLVALDGNEDTSFRKLHSFKGWSFTAVSSESSGSVWFALKRQSRDETSQSALLRIEEGLEPQIFAPLVLNAVGEVTALYEHNGRLWIGGSGGVAYAEVNQMAPLPPPPPVHLSIESDAERTPEGLQLPYSAAKLAVEFSPGAINGGLPYLYQTRVSGLNEGWSEPSNTASWQASGLQDRNYTLEVRTVAPDGTRGKISSIDFTVLPPWHRTSIAYTAYVLAAAVLVILFTWWKSWIDRRRVEDLERIVAERTEQLQQANRAKSEFVASMSHEIRNPLNGIVVAGEILGRSAASRHQSMVRTILSCTRQLSEMLNEVLDFSMIEAREMTIHERAFFIHDLVEEVVQVHATASEFEARSMLQFESNADEIPLLLGDSQKLRQILSNLISNALKYGDGSPVLISLNSEEVARGRWQAKIHVRDQGPGLPAEVREEIFTPFKRGKSASRSRISGTGLGLAICKAYADAIHADLTFHDNHPTGTDAVLSITLSEAPDDMPAYDQREMHGSLKGLRFLVVDDMEYNRVVGRALLEELEAEVEDAQSMSEALEKLHRNTYDWVLLDWDMPDGTGFELVDQLPPEQTSRVLVCSAFLEADLIRKFEARGVAGFLNKPLSPPRLLEATSNSRPANADDSRTADASSTAIDFVLQHPDLYMRDFQSELETLSAMIEEPDWPQARSSLHRIEALTGYSGSADLAQGTEAIRQALIAKNQEKARQAFEHFKAVVETFLQGLSPIAESD